MIFHEIDNRFLNTEEYFHAVAGEPKQSKYFEHMNRLFWKGWSQYFVKNYLHINCYGSGKAHSFHSYIITYPWQHSAVWSVKGVTLSTNTVFETNAAHSLDHCTADCPNDGRSRHLRNVNQFMQEVVSYRRCENMKSGRCLLRKTTVKNNRWPLLLRSLKIFKKYYNTFLKNTVNFIKLSPGKVQRMIILTFIKHNEIW